MTRSKLPFFLIIFTLITAVIFVVGLAAQDTEENKLPVQEFITAAQEFIELGEIEKAIEIYERIVKALPDDLTIRAKLATLYSDTKQHEKAAETYSQLLEAAPENIEFQDGLVNSLQAAGKGNEALEVAQEYIQSHPEVGIHYARLARLFETEGDEATAIANYKKATEYGYGDKEIYLRLAEHYFMNEDIAAAEKALKNAIPYTTAEWERERVEKQLIYLYLYQGILEEMSQKAEAEGTLTFEMQKQRAQHFYNTGELEKAANAFKKALEMTKRPYKRDEAFSELLNLYLEQNGTDLALDFYEIEISKQPISKLSSFYSSPGITYRFVGDDARQTLINAYKDQGRLAELRTHFEGKLEKDQKNLAILELLAEIYWGTNNYQKAAETYHTLYKAESNYHRRYVAVYQAAAAFWRVNQSDMAKKLLNRAETELAASTVNEDESLLVACATICFKNEMYESAIKLAVNAVSETQKGNSHLEQVSMRHSCEKLPQRKTL